MGIPETKNCNDSLVVTGILGGYIYHNQSDLVSTHKWPLQGLSDLHLGDQKVTLKKLYIHCLLI